MKVKHTPGPWEMSANVTKHTSICTVYGTGQGWIDVHAPNGSEAEDYREESLANAVLISAAPDMLQALLALNEIQHGKHPLKINVMAAWALLDAAIAKVKGGAA